MSSSQTNTIASEILSDDPLSEGTLAYLEARAKNAFYDYVITKFREAEQSSGLTKAKLARRVGKGPDRISQLLGAPGNWTLKIIATLLAGISKEELLPHSASFLNRPPRNIQPMDLLVEEVNGWGAQRSVPPPAGTTKVLDAKGPVKWERPQ